MKEYTNYSAEQFAQEDSFRRWVLSPSEELADYWQTWQYENPGQHETINQAKLLVLALHKKFGDDLSEQTVSFDLSRLVQRANQTKSSGFIWSKMLWAAAACVVFGLIAMLLVFTKKSDEKRIFLTNKSGSVQKINLPDGTKIWLNTNAKIEYPEKFNGESRNFYLTEGEAFFEVARNLKKPFQVHSTGFKVTVLGTSFNIKTLKSIQNARITVASGEVKVKTNNRESGILRKNDQLVIDNFTGAFTSRKVDAGQANAWRKGDVYLDDVAFEELVHAIEQTYGVSLSYPKFLKKQNANISFSTQEPITSVLEVMSSIYKVKYEVNGKEVTLQ